MRGIGALLALAFAVLAGGIFTGTASATDPVIEETYDFVNGDDWDRYDEWNEAADPDPSSFLFAAMRNDVEPELCPADECGLLVAALGPESFSAGDAGMYYVQSWGGEAAHIKAVHLDRWAYYHDDLEDDDPRAFFATFDDEGEMSDVEYRTASAYNEPGIELDGASDVHAFGFGLLAEESSSVDGVRGAYLGKVRLQYEDTDDPVLAEFSSAVEDQWVSEEPFDAAVEASDQGLGLTQVQVTAPLEPPDHYEAATGQVCSGTREDPCPFETEPGAKVTIEPSELPDGPNTLTAKAWDVYDHSSTPMEMDIKVDKTKPGVGLGGTFMSAPGMVLDGPSYTLDVDATDGTVGSPNSGVVDLKVKIDNTAIASNSQSCPSANCSIELNPTIDRDDYSNGDHQLKVVATDAVGHVRTTTVDFEIQGSAVRLIEETYDFVTGADWDKYGDWSEWPSSPSDFLFAAMKNDVDPELCPLDECGLLVAAEASAEFSAGDKGVYYINPPGFENAYIDSADVDKWSYYGGTAPVGPGDLKAVYGLASDNTGGFDDPEIVDELTIDGPPLEFRGGADAQAFGFGLVSDEQTTVTEVRGAYLGRVTLRYGDTDDPELAEFSSPNENQWVDEQPFQAAVEASDLGLGLTQVQATAPLTPPDHYESAWGVFCTGKHDDRCPEETPTGAEITIDPSELPDGPNTLTAKAWDVVDRSSTPIEMVIKVDKTKPGIDLGGTFISAPGMVLDGPSYSLDVDATDGTVGDPNSGVVSVEVLIDNSVIDSDSQSCLTQNCQLGLDPTVDPDNYSNGPHQLKVKATDAVGHVRTTTVDFEVDR